MAGQLKANHETWGSTVVELHTKPQQDFRLFAFNFILHVYNSLDQPSVLQHYVDR